MFILTYTEQNFRIPEKIEDEAALHAKLHAVLKKDITKIEIQVL